MCIRKSIVLGTKECFAKYGNESSQDYCPSVWDSYLCWPPTAPGDISSLPCPRLKGNDVSKFAFRTCLENGTWAQRGGSHGSNPLGWTNYTVCINPYIQELMDKVEGSNANLSQNEFMMKHSIAEANRKLEMFGLTLSIISLIISLNIFYRFRNLQNNRTRIHKNLFIAMSIQVIVRLTVYVDQYLAKITNSEFYTIETTEYTCESAYILLEYARTAMFLWMFVEGLYLHNMITVAVFQERLSLTIYYMIGWGSPVLMVLIWGSLTYRAFYGYVCWWGYNLSGLFWVLEGPRLLVIGLNLLFLLNIIRVLVTKLRESNSTEAQQVRKAVRAAIVLLPLLGITNSIQMLHSPADKNIIQFAIWSYVTTFLTSFQGFFCALIYCFLNGEVQLSVKRFFKARKHRGDLRRRKSLAPGASVNNGQNNVGRDSNSNHRSRNQSRVSRRRLSRGNEDEVEELNGRNGGSESPVVVKGRVDPFFENWSDGELSSHNHVDVEHIEIPLEYLIKHEKASKVGGGLSGAGGSGLGHDPCGNNWSTTTNPSSSTPTNPHQSTSFRESPASDQTNGSHTNNNTSSPSAIFPTQIV